MAKVKQTEKTNKTEVTSVQERQKACAKEMLDVMNKYGMRYTYQIIPVILPIDNEN